LDDIDAVEICVFVSPNVENIFDANEWQGESIGFPKTPVLKRQMVKRRHGVKTRSAINEKDGCPFANHFYNGLKKQYRIHIMFFLSTQK
jgi:hypothetical protein